MDVRQGWSQQIRSDYIVVRCYSCGRFFKCYGIRDEDRECELFKNRYMEDCCCNECVETDIGCICSPPLTKEEVLEEKKGNVVYPPADIFRKWKASSLKELWIKISEKL